MTRCELSTVHGARGHTLVDSTTSTSEIDVNCDVSSALKVRKRPSEALTRGEKTNKLTFAKKKN